MVKLPPHIQCLVDDCDELIKRTNELKSKLPSKFYQSLPKEHIALMERQCAVMAEYADILAKRIKMMCDELNIKTEIN